MSSSYLMYHNLLASSADDNKAKIQKNRPETFADQKCRLCREKPGSIRLFNNELRTNIVGEIYSVTGVVFRNMKDLSTYICQSCVDQLDSSIRFRNMCQQSNRAILEVNVKQEYCDIEKTLPTDKKNIVKNQSIKKEEDIFNNDKSKFISVKKNTATNKVNTNEEKNFLDSSDTDDDDFDNFNDDDNLNDEGDKSQCTYNKNLECLVPNSWAIPKLHEILKKKEKKPKELKQHLCDSCGKEFDSLIRLKYHMVIHENVFPFACDKCPYKGRTKNTLVTHMKSHLPYSERTLCCPHCSKKTTTTSNMNSHIRRVHTNNGERNFKLVRAMSSSFHIYHTLLAAAAEDDKTKIQKNRPKSADQKCRVCCEKTGSIQLFNNELRTNFIGEIYSVTGVLFCYMQDLSTYICQSCVDQLDRGLRFRDMCRQSNRIIMEVNVKQEYNCNNGETQTDKKYMIKSQSIKKEENMFQENKCICKSVKNTTTKKFKIKANDKFRDSSDNFNDEEDNSQDVFDKKYGCKVSKSPETLKKKKKIPKEPTQHLCASCGKSFTKLHDLKNHMVIHENVFPFACDKCPYKGRTKSTLVVHMKSHLAHSERPLSCPHCSIKTTTASNLNAHIRRVHNNGERNFKCTRCEKDFINKGDLRRHINMVHENMGNTSCQICYKVFKKTSLRTHLWRFHKIKKEKLYSRMPAYLRCNQTEDQP